MASSYSNLIIVGHLGSTPELRHAKDGKPVTTLSVAVNDKSNGEATTTWYTVTVWAANAENAVRYLDKGSKILVEGTHLKVGAYLNKKDNQPVGTLTFTATRIVFLDDAKDTAESDMPL